MTKTPLLITLTLAAALTGALAGCTGDTTATPTPSPTDHSKEIAEAEARENKCVDGFAWMTFAEGDTGERALPEGCDTVIVQGNGGTVTTGDARVVVIMGSDVTVHAQAVEEVDMDGSNNTVTHNGTHEVTVTTDGENNNVTNG